jgi:hypothetical protein
MGISEHGSSKLNDDIASNKISDRDLLIKIYLLATENKSDVGWAIKILGNHLKHHWAITLAATGAAISALIALIISWVN